MKKHITEKDITHWYTTNRDELQAILQKAKAEGRLYLPDETIAPEVVLKWNPKVRGVSYEEYIRLFPNKKIELLDTYIEVEG